MAHFKWLAFLFLSLTVACAQGKDEEKPNKEDSKPAATAEESGAEGDGLMPYLLEEDAGEGEDRDGRASKLAGKIIAMFDTNDDKALDQEELTVLIKKIRRGIKKLIGHKKPWAKWKDKEDWPDKKKEWLDNFKEKWAECFDLDGDGEISAEEKEKAREDKDAVRECLGDIKGDKEKEDGDDEDEENEDEEEDSDDESDEDSSDDDEDEDDEETNNGDAEE